MSYGRYSGVIALVALVIGASWTSPADAQERRRGRHAENSGGGPPRGERPRPEGAPERQEPEPYPVPPQLYRDFAFPDPDRPWGGGRYLDPYDPYDWGRGPRRGYTRRGRGRGYRGYWYDDYTYRFGVPNQGDPYGYDLEQAYRQGVADGQNYERFEIQAERGLAAYQRAMLDGHAAFAAGEYGVSARHFLLAATLNQGDAASRLSAAHAQIALGAYEPAARLLRRAFELQPKIIYLPMDIRAAYANPADFAKHLSALRAAASRHADQPDLWFLLGYCLYYTDDVAGAAKAFDSAVRLSPDDALLARLAELAAMAAPPTKKVPAGRTSQPPHPEI